MEQENDNGTVTNEELARMIARGFEGVDKQVAEIKTDLSSMKDGLSIVKTTLAEMRADHIQLEDKVDAISGILANVPTKHDLEHMLEKTYHLAQITAEHIRMKKIIQEKLGVEV